MGKRGKAKTTNLPHNSNDHHPRPLIRICRNIRTSSHRPSKSLHQQTDHVPRHEQRRVRLVPEAAVPLPDPLDQSAEDDVIGSHEKGGSDDEGDDLGEVGGAWRGPEATAGGVPDGGLGGPEAGGPAEGFDCGGREGRARDDGWVGEEGRGEKVSVVRRDRRWWRRAALGQHHQREVEGESSPRPPRKSVYVRNQCLDLIACPKWTTATCSEMQMKGGGQLRSWRQRARAGGSREGDLELVHSPVLSPNTPVKMMAASGVTL